MADNLKTRRNGPGAYEVTDGTRVVCIVRNDSLSGPDKWIAYAQWDRYCVTDPRPTLRDTKAQAAAMLTEARKEESAERERRDRERRESAAMVADYLEEQGPARPILNPEPWGPVTGPAMRFLPVYTTPGNNPAGYYIRDRESGGIVTPASLRLESYDAALDVAARYDSAYGNRGMAQRVTLASAPDKQSDRVRVTLEYDTGGVRPAGSGTVNASPRFVVAFERPGAPVSRLHYLATRAGGLEAARRFIRATDSGGPIARGAGDTETVTAGQWLTRGPDGGEQSLALTGAARGVACLTFPADPDRNPLGTTCEPIAMRLGTVPADLGAPAA